jgi:Endonuclease/Exonuclease/phosphatase family
MHLRFLAIFLASIGILHSEPLMVRALAANLTSGNKQAYSVDNGNHSNPEGAGARIIKALKPDIVMIQEFNTSGPVRQWLNKTLGENYHFTAEKSVSHGSIPNGIISRFPIMRSGVWDDPVLSNREFVWAQIRLPQEKELWVVSLHLHTKTELSRATQAEALAEWIQKSVPKDALLLIGGDFNTRSAEELCFKKLSTIITLPANPPADHFGMIGTNAKRNNPYDWVLASASLDALKIPVKVGNQEFPHGLVFDSRIFEPLSAVAPVQVTDSAAPNMQHMAVVRDFLFP